MSITTSIVIPAFNEASRLQNGFERLQPVLELLGVDVTEVIIVDDGSTDDTLHVANDVYGHLPHRLFVQQPRNFGKGAAVRLGISVARGDYVIAADADMAIQPRHFPGFIDALHRAQLAPGSRSGEGRIRYESVLRTFAGDVFSSLVHHYARTKVRDTQCGCKGFQLGTARLLALLGMIDGFAYDAELFYLSDQLHLSIEPVNVEWDDVPGSTVKIGRVFFDVLRDLRHLHRTHYENPVVVLSIDANVDEIRRISREARVQGLVLARGSEDSLLVLPRDAALGGVSIAQGLHGTLRTTGIESLRERTLEPI